MKKRPNKGLFSFEQIQLLNTIKHPPEFSFWHHFAGQLGSVDLDDPVIAHLHIPGRDAFDPGLYSFVD